MAALGQGEVIPTISRHLHELAVATGSRPPGSEANQRAERYIAGEFARAGYAVERQPFDCLDWQFHDLELRLATQPLEGRPNPFSPSCDVTASFVPVASIEALQDAPLQGRIALLHGELSAEPLFPRNFPFFQVEQHQRLLQILDERQPVAVVMVSPRSGNVAPLIEDGDFTLPSITVGAEVGARILAHPGHELSLRLRTTLRPSHGANVVARPQSSSDRDIVLCAHFDTKHHTPGALDNASGVATLLALSEILAGAHDSLDLEFIAFNGEDNYAAPGQVTYLRQAGASLDRIRLVINVDGVGLKGARNTIAFFGCQQPLVDRLVARVRELEGLVEIEPWPQGDHMVFAMRGVPAIAFSSEIGETFMEQVIHTLADTLEKIDPRSIADVVTFLPEVLRLARAK